MGANWNYQHPSEIMAEMASLTPLYEGVSYDRLEDYKTLQWPVAPDGTDQPAPELRVGALVPAFDVGERGRADRPGRVDAPPHPARRPDAAG